MQTDWLALSQPLSQQIATHLVKNGLWQSITSEQDKKDKWQTWRKDYRPPHIEDMFVVMGALVNVLVGDVLILHCYETDDCHAVALRASSELSQSADYQSVRSRVW